MRTSIYVGENDVFRQ